MKKNFFDHVLLVLGCCVFSACSDTTALGGMEEEYWGPASQDSSLVVVQNRYNAEFDTHLGELYTVSNVVEGEVLTKQDNIVVNRQSFSCELDLNVLFRGPQKVYVSDEKLLSQVEKVSHSEESSTKERVEDEVFARNVYKLDFHTVLNANEQIVISARYEKASRLNQELCYTSVKQVTFNNGTSVKNDELTTKDSIVYDVLLTYDVVLIRHDLEEKETLRNYTVNVSFQRIYRVGDVKKGVHALEVKRELISTTTERLTVTSYEEWSVSGRTNEQTDTINLPLVLREPLKKWIRTSSKDYNTTSNGFAYQQESSEEKGRWVIKTKPFTYSSTATNSVTPFDNVYEGSSCAVVYTREDLEITFDYGTWHIQEGQSVITGPSNIDYQGVTYEGYNYVNNITWTYSVSADEHVTKGNEISTAAKSEAVILIAKDVLLSKKAENLKHEILDEEKDKFTWQEVEQWSQGGTKTTQKEWVRYRHFHAPEKQTIYTRNKDYHITSHEHKTIKDVASVAGDVKVTTRYMTYTAHSDNQHNAFDNVYAYDMQSGVYQDPEGKYTLTFDFPTWTVEEKGTNVSSGGTRKGDYVVYTHTHNINHAYKVVCNGQTNSSESSAKALADLYVLDIAKNIPQNWGTIVSLGVTAVPADDVQGHYDKKAFCLVTTKGAVAVVVDRSVDLPTVEQINAGYFVEGSFDSSYNSAFFTKQKNKYDLQIGKWAPAVGKDEKGIKYYYKGHPVAAVRATDINIWSGWKNGQTVHINGYKVVLEDGVLTLTSPNHHQLRLH